MKAFSLIFSCLIVTACATAKTNTHADPLMESLHKNRSMQQEADTLLSPSYYPTLQDALADSEVNRLQRAGFAKSMDNVKTSSPLHLTPTEADVFRRQLSKCWAIEAGARHNGTVVEIHMIISRDRTILEATIVDQKLYNNDEKFRLSADSAIRGLLGPHCKTLQLPPKKYETWKDIIVVFNAHENF